MKSSAIIGIGIAVVAAASIVGYISTRPPATDSTSADPNDRMSQWVCVAKTETHDFEIRVGDLAKIDVVCPVCGSTEVWRALACPNCGRHYPVGRYNASPEFCAHCNEPLPGAAVDVFHSHAGH